MRTIGKQHQDLITPQLAGAMYEVQSLIPFWLIFAIVTAGFLFSFYFLSIQAFILQAFCPWCVLSAIVFSILFYISVLINSN